MGFDLNSIEEYASNHFKLFIFSVAGIVVLVGVIALTVFFIAIRGQEQTMVPNVVGRELTSALLELQVKELYPRIQLRPTQTSADRGLILEQDPRPGTIVKAGRRIRLVVSQGAVLNRVENYVTRNLEEVRMELQTINASIIGPPLLTIREPIMYEFSDESPGTILQQRPEPGTDVTGPTTLEFVVSRGRENLSVMVPQFQGLDLSNALQLISTSGVNFQFNVRERRENESYETVVEQSHIVNTMVPINTVVQLTITPPQALASGEVFGLFSFTMPQNPYPLAVRLDAILPTGERRLIFTVNYMGGTFTVPYRLPEGSELVLMMLNRELHREMVRGI
ncbi:MAG: PASTA domain-containing protein [Treponema sp.]|nr:PASTA domain-containing protein [Treponema sp.]